VEKKSDGSSIGDVDDDAALVSVMVVVSTAPRTASFLSRSFSHLVVFFLILGRFW
jgi:hypothetical protein